MLGDVASRIRQRRSQMLVHSYLYYVADNPIVLDTTWQQWADELVALQAQHAGRLGFYDEAFADWSGDTGMHLPQDSWVTEKALRVRMLYDTPALRQPPAAARPAPPPAPVHQASLF